MAVKKLTNKAIFHFKTFDFYFVNIYHTDYKPDLSDGFNLEALRTKVIICADLP